MKFFTYTALILCFTYHTPPIYPSINIYVLRMPFFDIIFAKIFYKFLFFGGSQGKLSNTDTKIGLIRPPFCF